MLTCGPVLIPYILANKNDTSAALYGLLAFSLGRLIVYMILGGVFGLFGSLIISLEYSHLGSLIRAVAALYIIFLGIYLWSRARSSGDKCILKDHDPSNLNIFLVGVVFGLVPCIPLTAILVQIALFSDNILTGAVLGLVFGLGTVLSPLLLFGGLAGHINSVITNPQRALTIRTISSGIIIASGIFYLLFSFHL